MGIMLYVDDWCEDCADFEPEVHRCRSMIFGDDQSRSCTETTVTCVNRDKCHAIYKFISDKKKEKNRT